MAGESETRGRGAALKTRGFPLAGRRALCLLALLVPSTASPRKRYREAGERYDKAAWLRWWSGVMYYNAACSWALAGVKDQALADLEEAFATGFSPDRSGARNDPDFTSLRDDPRFRRLVDPNSE